MWRFETDVERLGCCCLRALESLVGVCFEVEGRAGAGGAARADSVRSILIRWVERRGVMVGRVDWNVTRSFDRRSSVSGGRGWVGSEWMEVDKYAATLTIRSRSSGERVDCEFDFKVVCC